MIDIAAALAWANPCPVCGSTNITMMDARWRRIKEGRLPEDYSEPYVECLECCVSGPKADSLEAAVKGWNVLGTRNGEAPDKGVDCQRLFSAMGATFGHLARLIDRDREANFDLADCYCPACMTRIEPWLPSYDPIFKKGISFCPSCGQRLTFIPGSGKAGESKEKKTQNE